jgi:thymidylate synthase ThyX
MRLCYNAQEEIWHASVDEAEQIRQVHPRLGRWLLPPCGLRARAGAKPPCPEGTRYCGIPVWRLDVSEYRRMN